MEFASFIGKSINSLIKQNNGIYKKHPLFLGGIVFYLGSLFIWLPFIFLPLVFFQKTRHIFFLCLFGSITQNTLSIPAIEQLPSSCTLSGVFSPAKLSKHAGFFDVKIILSGRFKTDQGVFELRLFNPPFDPFSCKNSFLSIEHVKTSSGSKSKILKHEFLDQKNHLFAFRLRVLRFFENALKIYPNSSSQKLFFALFTGQIEDRLMLLQFKDFGLSHLLALSGFHLQLVLTLCNFTLKKCVRFNIRQSIGLFILSIYCLFIGSVPSIVRAFFSILFSFLLTKETFEKKPLTIFGLTLIATSILCPNQLTSPGFILSFIATFAITSFESIKHHLVLLFQAETDLYSKLIKTWICHFFCQLWITLFSVPFLLFYFQSFHLESIFYNLFVPYLICIGMWITSFCIFLQWITTDLSQFLLGYIYQFYDGLFFLFKKPLMKNLALLQLNLGLFSLICIFIASVQLVFFLEQKKSKAR